ncbi:MAG: SusD/RagB family nutrient-binding outer membrane lipoprotein [Bacteroidota bacterium]|nr:SusD/RagB family nutrient-binding outer membrane lipoprotein [Bacteroidota bacterium]
MKILYKLVTGGLIAILMSACTSDFEEINTNPNATLVGQITASNMFEPLLYNGANTWLHYSWCYNDELIQYTAFTGGSTRQEHRYFLADTDFSTFWNFYARYANNAIHMYELAAAKNDVALEAIAQTLKVLYMSNLTDMYGDIPYSEAFTAQKIGGTTTPKFDSQKEVYQEMFAELEAANDLYATNPVFEKPTLDGMYAGNILKWRKFNNSLYLRLLCRISGRTEMNAGTKMKEILTNKDKYPIFESNDDNATVKYSGTDPYRNYFATTTEGNFSSSAYKITRQVIKMTVVTDATGAQTYVDPRLPIYGKKNPNAKSNPKNIWIGTVGGCTPEEQSSVDLGSSWLNAAVFCRADAPATFMDYAEVKFILAEAALKGLIDGGESAAKSYYTDAVTASMQKWAPMGAYSATPVTITDADIITFLNSDLASWDKATNKEELIANQKYIALFFVGMEAYHEFRRTGYPVLTIGAGTVYNDFILPTRFAYPTVTIATNGTNAQVALDRMGGANNMKTPVWWSKQAIGQGK